MIRIENLIINELLQEKVIMESTLLIDPSPLELPYVSTHGFITREGHLYIEKNDMNKDVNPVDFLKMLNKFDKSIGGGRQENYEKDLWITLYGIYVELQDGVDPKTKRHNKVVYLGVDAELQPNTLSDIRDIFTRAMRYNPTLSFNIKRFK